MKQNKLVSIMVLLSMVLAALVTPTVAQEPDVDAEPARAPKPAVQPAVAPAAPEPDWGGSWQFGPTTDFAFTRFDGGYYPGDGLVYFMGGRLVSGSTPDTDGSVWTFDPVTGVYTDTSLDLITPISNYTMNLLQDGSGDWGFYTFCGRPTGGGITDTVQIYYPDTNTAVQLSPADSYPGTGNCTSAMNAVYDNKVYVAGGFDPAATPSNWDETWIFDPTAAVGSKWTQIPSANLNLARAYIMSAVVDDKIYAVGGNWFDGAALVNVDMVEVLDPNAATPTWDDASVADLPEVCSESRAYGFDSSFPYVDPDGTPLAGKIVSGCGGWSDENNHVYVYDTGLNFWEPFPFFGEVNGRRDHAADFVPDTPGMWVWGGINEGDANVLTTSEYYQLNPPPECDVLLVDDDWDFTSTLGGGRPYYTSTLDYLGVGYDLWDTVSMSAPTALDMAPYEVVIWFTGYDWVDPISPTVEAPELMTYLDGGGNLFMSSQEQEYAYPGSTIMSDYFWVNSVTGDVVLTGTLGNAADPLYAGLGPYPMGRPDQWEAYWPTGNFQGPYDDVVTVKVGGFEPMVYSDTLQSNSTRFEGGSFRTVYLGYPLEWVEDVDARAQILNAAIAWFCAPPAGDMQLIPPGQSGGGVPGATVPYTLTVINDLGYAESFSLTYTSTWPLNGPMAVGPVADGGAEDFVVEVTVPTDTNCYESDLALVHAMGHSDPLISDTAVIETASDPSGMGDLVGTVYDANTGLGIENAYVYLELGDEYYEGWADADGAYRLPDVPTCVYEGGANAVGYFNYYFTATTPMTMDIYLDAGWPDLSHDAVSVDLLVDTMDTLTMTLANSGTGDLHFYMSELPNDAIYPMHLDSMPSGVDARVYEDLAGGAGKVMVYMAEQADLSAAFTIEDWAARGQYVLDSLRATAERSQAGLKAELDAAGVSYQSHYLVNALVVEGDLNLVQSLIARPDVAYVGPNLAVPAPEPVGEMVEAPIPDAVEWNIAQVNADDVWSSFGVTGTGVVVANIDTGVLYTHTALVNQYRGNMGGGMFDHNYNWWDPYGDVPNYPYDWDSHGSHTMGTMLGDDGGVNQIGMAPGAQWLACNGFDHGGSGYTAELLECAEFLLAPWDLNGMNPDPALRPHVINNSWGGGPADWWYNQAIYAWRAAGIIGIFSAGNSGPNCETVGAPDYANILLVGATDNTDTIAGFSSRGPTDIVGLTKPNVSAPGVNVRSAIATGGYGFSQGTSMAAPHVAGQAALLWSAQPDLIGNVEFTYWLIEQSAMGIADGQCGDPAPPNNVYGWGRIDAYDAVSMALDSNWQIDWLDVDPMNGVVAPMGSADVGLTFDATGLIIGTCYTGTLRAEYNDPYVMEAYLPVEMCVVECVEVSGVDLTLETTGTIYVDDAVDFSADIMPDSFTAPYTYTVDYGDGTSMGPASGSDDPMVFTHAYTQAGNYTVEFWAWNCDMTVPVTDSVEVMVMEAPCTEIETVTVTLETMGDIYTNTMAAFSANIGPDGFDTPYTYTIDYGDGMTMGPTSGSDDPMTFGHVYTQPGTYTLEFAAWNCDMTIPIADNVEVVVMAGEQGVPNIGVTPPQPGTPVLPGATYTRSLGITNDGGTTLTWSLTEVVAVDWLSEMPTSGELMPAGSQDVMLTFDATGLMAGVYTTELRIDSNDPSNPMVTVPVSMTVYEEGCVDITGVSLAQVTADPIYTGDQVDFVANLAPNDLTTPYTFTIDFGDGTLLLPDTSSADPYAFNHTYTAPGTYTVAFAAWNCDMMDPITDTVEVVVMQAEEMYMVYLPIVVKND